MSRADEIQKAIAEVLVQMGEQFERICLNENFCKHDIVPIYNTPIHEIKVTKVLDVENKGEYEIRTELWDTGGRSPEKEQKMVVAYSTHDNSYIGSADEFVVKWIKKYGLTKVQKSKPSHNVASIAFCPNYKKDGLKKGKGDGREVWIGWSHRAACPFGIGDQLFKEGEFKNHKDPDKVPFIKVGKERIKTLDQAKQAAINFASSVS